MAGVYLFRAKGDYAELGGRDYDYLNVFCYRALPTAVTLFFSTASMKMDLPSDDYEVSITDRTLSLVLYLSSAMLTVMLQVYIGPNVTAVARLAKEMESAWLYSRLPWRSKEFKISPFEDSCIGVQTSQESIRNITGVAPFKLEQ